MAKSKKAIMKEAIESLGWNIKFKTQVIADPKIKKYVVISGHSEAGEDLDYLEFYESLDEIPEKFFERYQNFDVDEHVAMWLEAKQDGIRGVPNPRVLVKDAEGIEQFLLKLSETLRDALVGKKPSTELKKNGDKLKKLFDLIDGRDRAHHGVYEAWDTINALVNKIYGIDIGDALILWEEQNGA